MYYLFMDVVPDKRKKGLSAQAIERSICDALVSGEINYSIEKPLDFLIDPYVLRLDYIPIANLNGGFLVSPQLLTIFSRVDILYRSYMVQLYDEKTKQLLSTEYHFLVIEQKKLGEIIDWERSEFWIDQKIGQRIITTLVLNSQCEMEAKPLFSVEGRMDILIHEQMREEIDAAHLQGIGFATLDTFSLPILGLEVQELKKRLQKRSQKAQDWYELGDALGRLYHYNDALQALEKALVLQLDFPQAWHRKGMLLHDIGSLQEALEAFQKEVEVSPMHYGWWDCCTLLREMGSLEDAVSLAQHFLQEERWRQTRPSWYQLGASYQAIGRYEEALQVFIQALTLRGSPFDDEIYLVKGQVLLSLGRLEEAQVAYEKGLAIAPVNIPLWQEKLKILQLRGHEEAAQEAQQRVNQLENARELRMTILVH